MEANEIWFKIKYKIIEKKKIIKNKNFTLAIAFSINFNSKRPMHSMTYMSYKKSKIIKNIKFSSHTYFLAV
jgi:hypothetical protein